MSKKSEKKVKKVKMLDKKSQNLVKYTNTDVFFEKKSKNI